MQRLKGFTDRDTKVPRQKRPTNGVKDLDTWIRIDPGVSTHGGDHTQKYLESHKLAGFQVDIMGFLVHIYLLSHDTPESRLMYGMPDIFKGGLLRKWRHLDL